MIRIFGLSALVSAGALVAAYFYGPTSSLGAAQAVALVLILGILEISLSFDNAVINASILRRMSPFWQRMFLTVGILIAVFGMRLVFPLLLVSGRRSAARARPADRRETHLRVDHHRRTPADRGVRRNVPADAVP